jgi:hypothetical protein
MVAIGFFMSSFSEEGKWIIDADSRLIIHGTTNVNTFRCSFNYAQNSDTLEFKKTGKTNELILSKNRMRIPVRKFDCGNRQITKDFWETLQADTHPMLNIKFRSLENIPRDKSSIKGLVDITLAGVTQRYTVWYNVIPSEGRTVLLKGNQSVNFSDFKLRRPQKLMGLIKVEECLEVEFNLQLREI